ncbi:MAG TPA: insulinase family protein [Bacteroidales bacterium]|nr:insulinase family protein [Bacteroidales bacterium]
MQTFIFRSIFTFMLILSGSVLLQGQSYDLKKMPSVDPKVRTGILDNGMHYYIRANKIPEKRGEFYIANNVGAILEDDDQNGLAHFTEHMSFNGTDHFPKKGILDYLATIGVKFGTNVNAGTSLEQTVFNLSNVPLKREGILDSALMVLRDWSHYVSFEDKEIDLERGVIVEEWRMYGSAEERMSNKLAPIIYKGSKYAKRNVIGDTAVLKHFKYETIKNFYHKWYRPDLQALIIVGDFDENVVEAKIKKLFSVIPKVENPTAKEEYPVPDNTEPLIGTAIDKEATSTSVDVSCKHDNIKDSDKNFGYMRLQLVRSLINNMFGKRMSELSRKENPPFISAFSYYGGFTRTKDAFTGTAQAANNEGIKALTALLTEMERMKRFGFIESEFERAKADLIKNNESRYMDRDKRKNRELVYPNVSNFLTNNPNPGIEFDYTFAKTMIPGITLQELNNQAKKYFTDENMVVTATGPEKEGITIPTEKQIKDVLAAYKSGKIGPYVDQLAGKKLIEKEPVPGKVVKTSVNKVLGTTEWLLSNGMKVVFRPSDIKEDELLVVGFREGGISLLKEEDLPSAMLLGDAISQMGVGSFSTTDLEKLMSGKRVNLRISTSEERDGVSGRVSPKDLETALQLVYLYFTQPRWNATDYKTWMEKMKANYINAESDPRKAFRDTISLMMANHHPRVIPMTYKVLDKVSLPKLQAIYKDRFSDPGNFTFEFAGKIDPEKVKPLFEKYLASLPSVKRTQAYKDNGIRPPKGEAKQDFKHEAKTPRTSIYINYNGVSSFSADDRILGAALRHVLELRYIESIREDEGGAYSVRVQYNLNKLPVPGFSMIVSFETDPLKADKLIGSVHREVKKMVEKGPSEADLQKAKEYFLKQRQEDMKENSWWLSRMDDYYFYNLDFLTGYDDKVKALNVQSVHDYAKKVLTQGNVLQVIMRP